MVINSPIRNADRAGNLLRTPIAEYNRTRYCTPLTCRRTESSHAKATSKPGETPCRPERAALLSIQQKAAAAASQKQHEAITCRAMLLRALPADAADSIANAGYDPPVGVSRLRKWSPAGRSAALGAEPAEWPLGHMVPCMR